MAEWFRIDGNRLLLDIKAVPGANKTEFTGIKDNRLCIRIAAAPEDGKANSSLVAFFAKILGCAKSQIVLQLGKRSRLKTLSLPLSVEQRLEQLRSKNWKE